MNYWFLCPNCSTETSVITSDDERPEIVSCIKCKAKLRVVGESTEFRVTIKGIEGDSVPSKEVGEG
jgi:hypothetical protein